MSRPILDEDDHAFIAEQREAGRSYGQIRRALSRRGKQISEKAISWHCLRLGAEAPRPAALQPLRPGQAIVCQRGGHVVRRYTPEEDIRLLQMEAEGLSLNAIGKAMGRRHNSIKGRLMTLARYEARREETQGAISVGGCRG